MTTRRLKKLIFLLCLGAFVFGAAGAENAVRAQRARRNQTPGGGAAMPQVFAQDVHSYSNPQAVRVRHVDLDWTVSFDRKILEGSATLTVERAAGARNEPLVLDTRDLQIEGAEASANGRNFRPVKFDVGDADKILGAPLTVELPRNARFVRVHYSTSPNASGLQWLAPEQTAGKRQPYMFSQAQAIHARSFIPLQDSPQVRVTYAARVRTPRGLLAVMSAEGNTQNNNARGGDYRFTMTRPIPSYLIAVAVGDLRFRPLGRRTGVYTEPSMLDKSAYELADTEKMVEATERIYGAYRWGRYDLLILPPSFPFGGMENPMLTFATPTILAGDRSLVSLVAHELAHSWSGNLVTNATWRDFWLNEGFTTYLERRIIEAVYGPARREMEATLGRQSLEEEMAGMEARDQILHVDLKGRDPDEGFTGVPYEKGALFLRWLEERVGRARFDRFVRSYFDAHAFQSITTETFLDYLDKNLLDRRQYANVNRERDERRLTRASVEPWIFAAGLPQNAPRPRSDAFQKVEAVSRDYSSGGRLDAARIKALNWTTQEWLHFLKLQPADLGARKMGELDRAFNFTRSGNSEVAFQWLMMSIKNNYSAAYPRLEQFLTSIGRRKFVRPLFQELAKTPEGMRRACAIYSKARPGYHPITQSSVDAIVKCGN